MATHLITGGAGFIGGHLAEALLHSGRAVRLFDDLSGGRWENLPPSVRSGAELIVGDIRDERKLRAAAAGVDIVHHHAARASVPASVADPVGSWSVNADGTLAVLLAARDAGVRRVVYAASSSAYGESLASPKTEDQPPQPMSPYAASKLAGEHLCRAFAAVYGLDSVCLRYFNIFGPRQDPNGPYAAVIPKFVTALLAGEPAVIFGDGQQSRDFTPVGNVVSANLTAAAAVGPLGGQSVNIALGQAVTLNELLTAIAAELGVPVRAEHRPARVGDVRHSLADVTLAARVLAWRPTVDFAVGLAETVAWFREQRRATAPRA